MSEEQLPEGWVWKKLGEIVTLSSEKYQPTGKDEFYVGLEYIEKGTGKISQSAGTERIDTVKNKFYPGELLYGKLRPNLNKTAIAPREGVCSTDILVFRPTRKIEIRYLHLLMITRQFVNDTSANTTGVNLPRVSTKYLINYPIPLPPLPVQQQIVARIEELFSELDAGVIELQTALTRLKTYRQAVLHHYLNNPNWERVNLGSLKTFSMYGPRFSKEDYSSVGVSVLRTTDIDNRGRVDTTNAPKINLTDNEYEKYKCRKGDVLITRTGSIGTFTIFNDDVKAIPGAFLIQYRVNDRIKKEFLFYILASPFTNEHFAEKVSGIGRPNLNVPSIDSLPFSLPDLSTQTQIVARIEERLLEADAMETTIRDELKRAENLRQSILKQAFEGKLVASDPEQTKPEELVQHSKFVLSNYGGKADQLTLF